MPLLNFQNLMGSPLGMAGLGLLMQPTQSYQPINPMAGVAQGMLAAGQYRQNEAQNAVEQQRAAMEQQRLQFEMEDSLRKRKQEAMARAEAERQRALIEAEIAKLPPDQQAIARLNPEAFASSMAGAMFPKPQAEPEAIRTYRLTHPEDAALAGFNQWDLDRRRAGAINLAPPEKPMSPSEISNLRGPNGQPLPYGVTPSQAAAMGATPVPPETPAEKDARTLESEMDKVERMKSEQKAIAQQNIAMLEDEIARSGGIQSIVPGTPAADRIEAYRTAAAIAMARAQSPKPEQEPNDSIVEQFRATLPGHLKASVGATGGINAAYDLVGGRPNPVSETGQIVPSQPQAGGWVTLPNGVQVREKR